MQDRTRPLPGIKLLAAFFGFGATMCALTLGLLLVPGTRLDALWRLNPNARAGFAALGSMSILLMFIIGSACATAAIGLARNRRWGRRLALAILVVNLIGDATNVLVRHDWRTLIGLPIGGALIAYLVHVERRA